MRLRAGLLSAFTAWGLAACTTVTPIDQGGSDPVAGWNAETRVLAQRSWLYAQLSSNAYLDYESYTLPGDVVQREPLPTDAVGYDFVVFDRYEGDSLVETIIAYRGTEPNAADWILGNVVGLQNDRGLTSARQVFEQQPEAYLNGVLLTVTGHSLGGSIAHHVTDYPLAEPDTTVTRSLVFNNAPRFTGFHNDHFDRTAVTERGDWLAPLRVLGNAPPDVTYSLNCQPGLDPARDHKIRALADCLTWIAAFDDPVARRSLRANIGVQQPAAQIVDSSPRELDELVAGVPVNPYAEDLEMARAIGAALSASELLEPLYGIRSGYRVEVSLPFDAKVEVVWWRNGVRQMVALVDCLGLSDVACAERVVDLGEALVQAQLDAVYPD